jgi:hypothetical protein
MAREGDKMRGVVVLMIMAASLFAANAFGQAPTVDDLRMQAQDLIVRYCLSAPEMSDLSDPTEHCACGARLMVADLDERQLTVFTRLFAHFPNRDAARAEADQMIAQEGYSQGEIQAIGGLLGSSEQIMKQCGS